MSKRKIDEAAVMSELKGESVFFPRKTDETQAAGAEPAATPEPAVTVVETPVPAQVDAPSVRTSVRPTERVKKRYPFEFYQDQIDAIKQWSLEDKVAGGSGNMSEMIRDAVDAYIAKRREDAP
jgi:hypothetical protein